MGSSPGEDQAAGPPGLTAEAVAEVQTATRVLAGVALQSVDAVDGAVSLPQLRLLAVLADLGPARSGDVARALGLEASTITWLANRMVAAGHVRRGGDPRHRGAVTLELTASGRSLVAKVAGWRHRELTRILGRLTPRRARRRHRGPAAAGGRSRGRARCHPPAPGADVSRLQRAQAPGRTSPPWRRGGGSVPGPGGAEAARLLTAMLAEPLTGYLRLSGRYGDAVRVPFAPGRCFFLLSRPEHAEHVLASGQDNYVKAFTYRPLRMLVGNGLLTSDGEYWRRHRRLIQPVFTRRQVTSFGPHMTAAARRLTRRWDALPEGMVIDAARAMSALTLEIAGQALFSADLTSDAQQLGRAMAVGQRAAVLATLLPLRWGPRSTRLAKTATRRLAGNAEGIDGLAARLVAGRRAAAGGGPPRDLLDVLLQARDEEGHCLTDTEIGDELSTFLLAGHETSANTLSWSLALLSAFPAARQRLEEELATVLGGRDPEPGDFARLPWTRAVVSEALRLYPPAWTIERDALASETVAGVPVPAGSLVVISPYLIHRHPAFWHDPAGFDPQRFLPGGEADPAGRHRYAFIPFGGGRRACIGASFAELETVLVLATIAQRHRLELTARGIPVPLAGVTLRPGRTLPMRLLHRT